MWPHLGLDPFLENKYESSMVYGITGAISQFPHAGVRSIYRVDGLDWNI